MTLYSTKVAPTKTYKPVTDDGFLLVMKSESMPTIFLISDIDIRWFVVVLGYSDTAEPLLQDRDLLCYYFFCTSKAVTGVKAMALCFCAIIIFFSSRHRSTAGDRCVCLPYAGGSIERNWCRSLPRCPATGGGAVAFRHARRRRDL